MATAPGQPTLGSIRWTRTATPAVVKTTSPTDSSRIARRLALKSTSEVCTAVAYSRGGKSPTRTISGLSRISGVMGRYDAATPTTISSSGAGKPSHSATAVPVRTTTASATSTSAISTGPL